MVISEKLEILDDYVKLFNANKKKADQPSLLRTLNNGFGGEDKVVALVTTAKARHATWEKADELENSLLSKWLSEDQLPTDVFKWLNIEDNVNVAFTKYSMNKFTKYDDDFNKKNPRYKQSAIEIYTKHFEETTVVNKLIKATDDVSTRSEADKLLTAQFLGWIDSVKTIDEVATILKVESIDSEVVIQQKLDTLVKFVIQKQEGEQHLVKTLTDQFRGRGGLALILQRACTTTGTTELQKKLFAALVGEGVTENFVSFVFKTGVNSLTGAQKVIVRKFEQFYNPVSG